MLFVSVTVSTPIASPASSEIAPAAAMRSKRATANSHLPNSIAIGTEEAVARRKSLYAIPCPALFSSLLEQTMISLDISLSLLGQGKLLVPLQARIATKHQPQHSMKTPSQASIRVCAHNPLSLWRSSIADTATGTHRYNTPATASTTHLPKQTSKHVHIATSFLGGVKLVTLLQARITTIHQLQRTHYTIQCKCPFASAPPLTALLTCFADSTTHSMSAPPTVQHVSALHTPSPLKTSVLL